MLQFVVRWQADPSRQTAWRIRSLYIVYTQWAAGGRRMAHGFDRMIHTRCEFDTPQGMRQAEMFGIAPVPAAPPQHMRNVEA